MVRANIPASERKEPHGGRKRKMAMDTPETLLLLFLLDASTMKQTFHGLAMHQREEDAPPTVRKHV